MHKIKYGEMGLTTDPLRDKKARDLTLPPIGKEQQTKLTSQADVLNKKSEKPIGYDSYMGGSNAPSKITKQIYSAGNTPGFSGFLQSAGAENLAALTSSLTSNLSAGSDTNSYLRTFVRNGEKATAQAIANYFGGPIAGALAGGAVELMGGLKDKLGISSQAVSNADLKSINNITGKDTSAEQKVVNAITSYFGNDAITPPWVTAMAGKKTNDLFTTKQFEDSDGFSNTQADANLLQNYAGKRVSRGAANSINSATDLTQDRAMQITGLVNNNQFLKNAAGTVSQQFFSQNLRKYNQPSSFYDGTAVGKEGLKLASKEEISAIMALRRNQSDTIEYLQNGGIIGVDTNILPEGALHKNLNHLEEVNPEIGEEVTTKGIPVVVTDENCNIEQVAEIEKEEIVFRKSFTEQLEELWKDGSEEAMIEAGKLLVEEIITNTQDNTGQLENGI